MSFIKAFMSTVVFVLFALSLGKGELVITPFALIFIAAVFIAFSIHFLKRN